VLVKTKIPSQTGRILFNAKFLGGVKASINTQKQGYSSIKAYTKKIRFFF
jgi:hypothetical protein